GEHGLELFDRLAPGPLVRKSKKNNVEAVHDRGKRQIVGAWTMEPWPWRVVNRIAPYRGDA
ncbi:MAG: hypothetical protein KC416_17265, partial [Myxococcales bacterium]|nr:hypothetical protein [Myxococcales bacterium]